MISRLRNRRVAALALGALGAAAAVAWALHREGYRLLLGPGVPAAGERPAAPVTRPEPPGAPRINLVLVSVDTLRADHLGCYGYPRPTSPRLDRLAAESVLFEQAIAHAPSTLPSHASLLTSLPPSRHGASWAASRPLPAAALTLAEALSAAGVASAAFHGGGQMAGEFGVGQGFDPYALVEGRFGETVDAALEWLDGAPRPFFLFLHTYAVHHPYEAPPELVARFDPDYAGELPERIDSELLARINRLERPWLEVTAEDRERIVAAYDAEIRAMDEALGRLLDGLAERRLLDESVVVVTSDHGEELGERGYLGWHSHTLFDELLRVPLLLRLPGGEAAGRRVAVQVRLLDVAPTAMDALGLPVPASFEGRSLLPLVAGADPGPPPPATARRDTEWEPSPAAVRTPRFKLELDRVRWRLYRLRLFDLAADPGETESVLAEHPGVAAELLAELRRRRERLEGGTVEVDAETREQLEALGYVEGGG